MKPVTVFLVCALAVPALATSLKSPTSTPRQGTKMDCVKEVRAASDLASLEALLLQCPKQKKDIDARIATLRQQLRKQATDTQLQLEAKELEQLKADGVRERFAIPISTGKPSLYESKPGAITVGFDGKGLTLNEGVVAFSGSGVILPTLVESIYRFDGQVDLKLLPLGISDFVVTGQEDAPNRLSFVIFDGKLVYLRGRGKVLAGGSKEILLGTR